MFPLSGQVSGWSGNGLEKVTDLFYPEDMKLNLCISILMNTLIKEDWKSRSFIQTFLAIPVREFVFTLPTSNNVIGEWWFSNRYESIYSNLRSRGIFTLFFTLIRWLSVWEEEWFSSFHLVSRRKLNINEGKTLAKESEVLISEAKKSVNNTHVWC